uniref:Uncharacterized protein n=1 Tax=Lactuca sativa TaxID=4236 RepID=A0A9R1W0W9_LACSA|nr:hypothetical protein LSAT_V11C300115420 [Lactuca sativa]
MKWISGVLTELAAGMASTSGTKDELGPPRSLSRRTTRISAMDEPDDADVIVDSELVPSSLASIAPILRVANEIEKDNDRVAYLCMFPNSTSDRSIHY